ncbi:hypothetical protein GCM10028804_34110 [Larkinella terrae]
MSKYIKDSNIYYKKKKLSCESFSKINTQTPKGLPTDNPGCNPGINPGAYLSSKTPKGLTIDNPGCNPGPGTKTGYINPTLKGLTEKSFIIQPFQGWVLLQDPSQPRM